MLRLRPATLLMSACLVALAAHTADAQIVATSFDELRPLIRRGETVYVTDAGGRTSKGHLGDLTPSSLQLLLADEDLHGARPQTFAEADVRQIRVLRSDSLLNGTLIGLAAVGGPWAIACIQGCYYNEAGAENLIRYIALITSAIGAGVGALVDAGIADRAVVYYRPPTARGAAAVSPFVTRSGGGMQLSIRF